MRSRDLIPIALPFCLLLRSPTPHGLRPPPVPEQTGPGVSAAEEPADFRVIEVRLYPVRHGQAQHFASYFDTFFPETFEQLGAITLGSFTDRRGGFAEIRGFHSMTDRAIVSAEFYYGAVWKEHRADVNSMLADADDQIMLMRPFDDRSGVPVLPSVDPRTEVSGERGVVIAEILQVKKGSEDSLGREVGRAFADVDTAELHQAGILVSLDAPNNFPQLPISTDGPFVIWLGVARDTLILHQEIAPIVHRMEQPLLDAGLLRGAPRLLVLDPTRRSRLRWRATWP
jgi:hypothetical protein